MGCVGARKFPLFLAFSKEMAERNSGTFAIIHRREGSDLRFGVGGVLQNDENELCLSFSAAPDKTGTWLFAMQWYTTIWEGPVPRRRESWRVESDNRVAQCLAVTGSWLKTQLEMDGPFLKEPKDIPRNCKN